MYNFHIDNLGLMSMYNFHMDNLSAMSMYNFHVDNLSSMTMYNFHMDNILWTLLCGFGSVKQSKFRKPREICQVHTFFFILKSKCCYCREFNLRLVDCFFPDCFQLVILLKGCQSKMYVYTEVLTVINLTRMKELLIYWGKVNTESAVWFFIISYIVKIWKCDCYWKLCPRSPFCARYEYIVYMYIHTCTEFN